MTFTARWSRLELDSTFASRDAGWLADLAPHLLTDAMRARLPQVKAADRAALNWKRRSRRTLL